ncbi:MAG: hypothetical protein WCU00_13855 [Candidatus Latescibacterota bacterium]
MKIAPKQLDYILLAGAMVTVFLGHISALSNHLVADSWVFVYPRTFGEILSFFAASIIPPDGEALWLRPIPMFSFWLENKLLFGTEWLPHLTNILFHVLNVWLVWLVVSFLLSPSGKNSHDRRGGFAAFTACLIYGLHPLTVGSVDWVAARFDVVCVGFGLTGMYFWLRWDAGLSKSRDLWLSILFLLGSLLSKEQGVVFLISCTFLSLLGSLGKEKIPFRKAGLLIPVALIVVYGIYRLSVFGGIGGYYTERHGLSILPPFNYFAAILFPYLNVIPDWTISWSFWAASLIITGLIFLIWLSPQAKFSRIQGKYILTLLVLFVLGIATTIANPALTFEKVMGHAESRFALIPVTVIAMLIGLLVSQVRKESIYRIALVAVLLWGVTAAWRTDVQIQAWKSAGAVAGSIIDQAFAQAPNPAAGSSMIFLEIPLNNDQYAYIYGIGLDFALRMKYHRNDFKIIRFASREDLRRANPERDTVFRYNKSTGELEKLHAQKMKK